MANETILIDDVIKELKTFLTNNPKLVSASINRAAITLNQHTKPLTKVKGKYPQGHTLIGDVVQGFDSVWNELGTVQVEHKILQNFHQKVNFAIVPADILHSYFAELYAEGKDPKDMPISKYIMDNELLPRVIDNMATLSISGKYDPARKSEFGYSQDGVLTLLDKMTDRVTAPKHPAFQIPLDALTDNNMVDQVTEFERRLPSKMKKRIKKIFMSENNAERYILDYEERFGQNKFQNNALKTRLGKREIVILEGMEDDRIFATTEGNFKRLIDVFDEPRITDIQKQDYKIKIFMEFWNGYDFLINEMVYVSNYTDNLYGLGSTEKNQKYYGFDGVTPAAA